MQIHNMEKLENFDSLNRLEETSNPANEQTGGGAFYVCGVKDCGKQFVGKKKEETVKNELLPHIKDVHQDVYNIITENTSLSEIQRLVTKNYLKKSRREQKKNYYCKVCPKNNGDPPRFSQVENVHQRSGLEAHVKRQHPEFWEQEEQKIMMKDNQIKWMNQWCGYDGPAKTKGGRPNKKFIIEKYNTETDPKMDTQLDEEDEQFFLSIGIDVQRNKQIGTEEYQKHLEISHELFNNKEYITQMQEPIIDFNEQDYYTLFQNILDPQSLKKLENLLHLIRNQKGDDEHQYPENCKRKISEILRICMFSVAQQMLGQNLMFNQGNLYQSIMMQFKNVISSFQEFIDNLQNKKD